MTAQSSTMAFALSTKVVIRDDDGRVLLIRRSKSSKGNPDRWDFPGGKADPGETFDKALLREVSEETGLTIALERSVGSATSEVAGHTVVYVFLEARYLSGDVQLSSEHSTHQWVTLAELVEIAGPTGELSPQFKAFATEYCRSRGYGPTPPKKSGPTAISPAWLAKQVGRYTAKEAAFKEMAGVLDTILTRATKELCPLAFVQYRAKDPSHFAEKIVRKDKYKDPLREITDLCGARVVTQTTSEAEAVCRFIRERFVIDEKNSLDALSRLSAREFDYRSVHYVVSFKPDDPDAPKHLHGLKAEIQVRTMLQHAWSDIGHDRLYKSGFKVPDVWRREAARIAAMLETADDAFTRLVEGVEAYRCNFGAYLDPDEMKREMEISRAVLTQDPGNEAVTHRLARLAIASGKCDEVVPLVRAFPVPSARLLCCMGIALCHLHRSQPSSAEFIEGRAFLQRAIDADPTDVEPRVQLAETASSAADMLALYHQAHRTNPADPRALAGYIRQRILADRNVDFIPLLRPSIEAAIRRCEEHAAVGVNIPWAFYCIAEFRLLLGEEHERECLEALCRAVHVPRAKYMKAAMLDAVRMLSVVQPDRHDVKCVVRFLTAAVHEQDASAAPPVVSPALRALAKASEPQIAPPVVIVAGGCDAAHASQMHRYRELIWNAFADFKGTIISGGTRQGISGLVAELGKSAGARIHTIGYLPETLPTNGTATIDRRYDEIRSTDGQKRFTALEPIQNWIDLICSGVRPEDVRLLGINGGEVAALEYRIAWALGAHVAVVRDSGREADKLEQEIREKKFDGMLVLPPDPATLRAYLRVDAAGTAELGDAQTERLARYIHARFLEENRHKNQDPAMRPWEYLEDSLQESNVDQVSYMIAMLSSIGLGVQAAQKPIAVLQLTAAEVEQLAEREHGRWNVERLKAGWRYAAKRDVENKLSPYLVAWEDLDAVDPNAKEWDRENVQRFPALLADAGLAVVRLT